jgi:hypothetical protein
MDELWYTRKVEGVLAMADPCIAAFLTSACFTHILAGMVGGFIGELGRNKNVLQLPHREGTGLDIGFLSGMLIGGFVGFIVDHNPALSGVAGYVGIKFVDYLVHQLFPEYMENKKLDKERDRVREGEDYCDKKEGGE